MLRPIGIFSLIPNIVNVRLFFFLESLWVYMSQTDDNCREAKSQQIEMSFLFMLISLARHLAILLIFSSNQLLLSSDFFCCFSAFDFTNFSSVLFLLLGFWFSLLFFSSLKYELESLTWDPFFYYRHFSTINFSLSTALAGFQQILVSVFFIFILFKKVHNFPFGVVFGPLTFI